MEQLARKAANSMWRKVGEQALATAITTFITEAIKAKVELIKKARLREEEAAFKESQKSQKASEAPESNAAEAASPDAEQEGPADAAKAPESSGESSIDFAAYVARQRR